MLEIVILVHFFGLIVSLIIYLAKGNYNFIELISSAGWKALIAGVLGIIITYSIAASISNIGVLETIMISITVQMFLSKLIDHFGILGVTRKPINILEVFAIAFFVSGVLLLRLSK